MDERSDEQPKAVCMTIVIVGALPAMRIGDSDPIPAFLKDVEAALLQHFPEFLPAYPPITITTSEVRDDWIKRS
jgi:hypothetical protein